MNRREFLRACSAAGITLALGGAGCASTRPTEPVAAWPYRREQAVVLHNVKIVDVAEGVLRRETAVTIRNGCIESLADEPEATIAEAVLLDGQGAVLIPGLINAHCHLNLTSTGPVCLCEAGMIRRQIIRNYEDNIAWGVTTVRDLGSGPKILRRDRERIDKGLMPGPHILTSVGIIKVPGGYPDFLETLSPLAKMVVGEPALYVETPAEARDHVKRYRDQGAAVIKIAFDHRSAIYGGGDLNTFTDGQLEAIKDEATRQSLPVAAHHLFAQGLERGLQFGIDSMEHVVTDAELTDAQIQKVVDAGVPHIPTLTSRLNLSFKSKNDPYSSDPYFEQAYRWRLEELRPEIPWHCDEKVHERCEELFQYYQNEEYARPENRGQLSFNPPFFTHGVVVGTRNLKRLIEAGALVGAGNDSGVPFTFPGMLHYELLLLTRAGMNNAQALRAATLDNARICRVEGVCGSVEVGKRADLVLLADNPLMDIRHAARVRAVFKEGRLVSQEDGFALIPQS